MHYLVVAITYSLALPWLPRVSSCGRRDILLVFAFSSSLLALFLLVFILLLIEDFAKFTEVVSVEIFRLHRRFLGVQHWALARRWGLAIGVRRAKIHQGRYVVQTPRIAILSAQALACTYGVLQYNRERDCMIIWAW